MGCACGQPANFSIKIANNICGFKPKALTLRYKHKAGKKPPGAAEAARFPQFQSLHKLIPHQSRLGNSSNYYEIPRQSSHLMAGLNFLWEVHSWCRRITKDGENSKPVYSEFHRIL